MRDTHLLQHFVTVYRSGSFRAAASTLGVTQSSVTKRIQQLEAQLGVRLFNRTTRSVEPTDIARELINTAELALQANGAFHKQARLLAGGELGEVRVGAIALAAETLVVNSLARLSRSHPDLRVEVVVGGSNIYQELASGDYDLAVGDEANFKNSPHAPDLRMERLFEERLVFVHRPDHPAARAKTLSGLLTHPLAIPSRYFNDNRVFATLAAQTSPAPHYLLNSLSACLSLVANSDVVTLAPESLVRNSVSAGENAPVVIANFDTGLSITLVLLTLARNLPTPAVEAFSRALAAANS